MTERDSAGIKDAFSVLAHDLRLDIVLALLEDWEAARTEPKSYSELMAAVGLEDSGRFNYHLEQLRGVYVAEVEDGYVPTASATALYRAVLAHRPTAEHSRGDDTGPDSGRRLDVESPCPQCGGRLVARYERQFCTVECPDCEAVVFTYPFPITGLDRRTDREVVEAVRRRASHEIALAASGQCAACAGRTTVDLDRPTFDGTSEPTVEIGCTVCSAVLFVPVVLALQYDPEVLSALTALDVPVHSEDRFGLDSDVTGTIRSEDPLRAAVEIEADAGHATAVVDDALVVQSVTIE